MKRVFAIPVVMVIFLSGCATTPCSSSCCRRSSQTSGPKDIPGGAKWDGISDPNSTVTVEFSVEVPFRKSTLVPVRFDIPPGCDAKCAAQKMAKAFNEQTLHECAAKGLKKETEFFEDAGSKECGDPLANARISIPPGDPVELPSEAGVFELGGSLSVYK